MQFLIIAYDGKDEDALARRMAARPKHIENIQKVKECGHVKSAGGILDDNGKMIGSFLVLEFDSREKLDAYLETEPYITENVWQDVKIEPCNVVIKDDEIVGK